MTTSLQPAGPVLRFDLRTAPWDPADREGLRFAIEDQLAALDEPVRPSGADHRILVVDTPAGLTLRQVWYEQLLSYQATGRVRLLCLLVGPLPEPAGGPGAVAEAEWADGRRLHRPGLLRSSQSAVLWAGDLRAGPAGGGRSAPDDPYALAVLVDLLLAPELFDEVLARTAGGAHGVAAPALRVLEQDLAPQARARAWSEALKQFAGGREAAAGSAPARSRTSEPALLTELRATTAGSAAPVHRDPAGPVARAHAAAVESLAEAAQELELLGGPTGLATGAGRDEYRAALANAERALGWLRDCVARALADGGPELAPSGAELTQRLAELGIQVEPPRVTRERIAESLRGYALGLLGEGLPLRAAAERFSRLAHQVAPLPTARLAPRLAELQRTRRLAAQPAPATDGALPPAGLPLAALAGLLGGLWPWPVGLVVLLVPLLLGGGALLGPSRLGRRTGLRQAGPPAAAGLAGALLGWLTGALTGPPPVLGAATLVAALLITGWLVLRSWRHQVRAWGLATAVAPARAELAGLEALLTEVAAACWAVEERSYCADAATAVVGVLRAAARAAEQEAEQEERAADPWAGGRPWPDEEAWQADDPADWARLPESAPAGSADDAAESEDGWLGTESWGEEWDDSAPAPTGAAAPPEPAPAAALPFTLPARPPGGGPRWLERDDGDGGTELVATLVGDLADATVAALEPYWGVMVRGRTGPQAEQQTADRVRALLALARTHLHRNGVLPPPPFARPHRLRSGPTGLLGIDANRVAEAAGPLADRAAAIQLTSVDQQALLSRDPAAAHWAHFAPAAARPAIERATGPAKLTEGTEVWTTAGRYAGLLCLLPLRPDAVLTVHQREPEEQPW